MPRSNYPRIALYVPPKSKPRYYVAHSYYRLTFDYKKRRKDYEEFLKKVWGYRNPKEEKRKNTSKKKKAEPYALISERSTSGNTRYVYVLATSETKAMLESMYSSKMSECEKRRNQRTIERPKNDPDIVYSLFIAASFTELATIETGELVFYSDLERLNHLVMAHQRRTEVPTFKEIEQYCKAFFKFFVNNDTGLNKLRLFKSFSEFNYQSEKGRENKPMGYALVLQKPSPATDAYFNHRGFKLGFKKYREINNTIGKGNWCEKYQNFKKNDPNKKRKRGFDEKEDFLKKKKSKLDNALQQAPFIINVNQPTQKLFQGLTKEEQKLLNEIKKTLDLPPDAFLDNAALLNLARYGAEMQVRQGFRKNRSIGVNSYAMFSGQNLLPKSHLLDPRLVTNNNNNKPPSINEKYMGKQTLDLSELKGDPDWVLSVLKN